MTVFMTINLVVLKQFFSRQLRNTLMKFCRNANKTQIRMAENRKISPHARTLGFFSGGRGIIHVEKGGF